MANFCPHCGAELVRAGALFCSTCGRALQPRPATGGVGPQLVVQLPGRP